MFVRALNATAKNTVISLYFPRVEILRKDTVSVKFWANLPKLCGNCVFPQNFYTRELGEITVHFAVWASDHQQLFEDPTIKLIFKISNQQIS